MEQKSEAMKAKEINLLKEWARKFLPEGYDKYDVVAKYDSTLSYDENKQAMREDLKTLVNDLKEQVSNIKAQQERMTQEEINDAEREAEEYNKHLEFNSNEKLDAMYSRIFRSVHKLAQGFGSLVCVQGEGGLGKSYNIRKALVTHKADYLEIAGQVTAAYLYRLIYENNGKILWFKDSNSLFMNQQSLNLLKAATETEDQRLLTKNNYSKDQDDLPDKFICKSKFIFDYNHVGENLKTDIDALQTRGDYILLALSPDDKLAVMEQIADTPEKKEVTEFIKQQYNEHGRIKLNLRTQYKSFKTYEWAKKNNRDWKEELKEELDNIGKTRALLYSLIGDKVVEAIELKKKMLKEGYAQTLRTTHRRVNDWIFMDELYKWSGEDRRFKVCINPRPDGKRFD